MDFSKKLTDKFSLPGHGLDGLNLFQRFEILEKLGMLAHEKKIGHPERPFNEWSKEELDLALGLFKTWPKFEDAEVKYSQLANIFATKLSTRTGGFSGREHLLTDSAEILNEACKEVYGDEFPDVVIDFKNLGRRSYAGLSPEGVLEVNQERLHEDAVNGSSLKGDASYLELLCHEAIHLVQRFASNKSDQKTENGNLSAQVSEAFYEATDSARGNIRDLHWLHPFEKEAREKAQAMVTEVLKLSPDLNVSNNLDGLTNGK